MKLIIDLVLNHVGPDAPLRREKPEWFHNYGPITDWSDAIQAQRGVLRFRSSQMRYRTMMRSSESGH
jgi:hypothetical protein